MERKLPTKAEWDEWEGALRGLFGGIDMTIDGYDVKIRRERISANQLVNTIYVNGTIKGEWAASHREGEPADLPEVTKRFYRRRLRSLYPGKKRKDAEKAMGKRLAKKYGFTARWVSYYPWWNSARMLRLHLLKNNHDIEIIRHTTI